MTTRRNAWLCRLVAVTVVFASTAAPALAQEGQSPATLGQVVENARLWIMGILAALATLFFVVGGVRYVMAGGDPGEVQRAKLTLKSAMAGYALALLAPVVLTVLRGIVGA
jgi:succinate dehydrogenase/fumarate reductase cytochrome b subunit